MHSGILCTQCPFAEPLLLRPHLTSLRPKDEDPNFLKSVIFWESSHKEKSLEGGALKAEIPEFRACIMYLFLSLLRELL